MSKLSMSEEELLCKDVHFCRLIGGPLRGEVREVPSTAVYYQFPVPISLEVIEIGRTLRVRDSEMPKFMAVTYARSGLSLVQLEYVGLERVFSWSQEATELLTGILEVEDRSTTKQGD